MGYAIVVDCSVARAAGESQDPVAKSCRDTLDSIAGHAHKLAMCKLLQDEWFKCISGDGEPRRYHASRYALQWLTKMTSERRVIGIELSQDAGLLESIFLAIDKQDHEQVRKDFHLVQTALASDKRIVSLDGKIRKHLCKAGQTVTWLCKILWLNPSSDPAPAWLQNGAPDQREYRLNGADN